MKLKNKSLSPNLPPIPDKRYFTISEAALLCVVKPHVLRYWEQEFIQLKPNKRRGNRRFYQMKDIETIRKIRKLLYEDGFTIEGAKLQLKSNIPPLQAKEQVVENLIADLESLLDRLKHGERV